jgi:hypothetical protein
MSENIISTFPDAPAPSGSDLEGSGLAGGDSSTGDMSEAQVGTAKLGGVSPMVNQHKKFPILLLFLIPILVIVAVISIYVLLQARTMYQQTIVIPSPTPVVAVDPTADWQTYTNSELGFSFKYPQGWNENDENSPGIISFTQNTEDRSFFVTFHKSISNIGRWLEDNQAGEIIETTTINNNEFTIIKGGSQYVSQEYAIVLPNMGLLRLVVEPFPNQIVTTEIINQILSTFHFLE